MTNIRYAFTVFFFQRKIMSKLANTFWPIMVNFACNWPFICFSFQAGIHQLSLVLHSTCGYHWQDPNAVNISTFFLSFFIFHWKTLPSSNPEQSSLYIHLWFEVWVLHTEMFVIKKTKMKYTITTVEMSWAVIVKTYQCCGYFHRTISNQCLTINCEPLRSLQSFSIHNHRE